MDNFPDEIITIILLTLPIKSILQCKSVCKSWYNIIKNPKFSQLHFSNPSNPKNSSFLLLSNLSNELHITKQDDQTLSNVLNTTSFEISPVNFERITCKCAEPPVNGLLFMYPHSHYDFLSESSCLMYVCNPSTRDCIELPRFNRIECSQATLIRGFGYDVVSNEFKVMQMATYVGGRLSDSDMESEVQVYTLGEDCWRNIGKGPDSKFVKVMSAFVNGKSHWLAVSVAEGSDNTNTLFSMDIVSFDFSSEKFGVVPSPEFGFVKDNDSVPEPAYFELTVLGECLSVVDCSFEHHMEIWIMKEYNVKKSWIKYSVTKYYLDRQFSIIQAVSLRNDSEIVLLSGGSRLVAYNLESKSFTPFEVCGVPGYSIQDGCSPQSYQVYSFDESLFSLKPSIFF